MSKTRTRKFSRGEPLPAPAPAPEAPKAAARPAIRPAHARIDENDLLALAQMNEADFAAMLSGSLDTFKVEVGQQVTGQVTRVTRETVFVDVGAKAEGQVERAEAPQAQVGDAITAYVLASDEYGVRLSQRLSGHAASAFLDSAEESGIPVTGKVVSRNPGGFEVKFGTTTAFCPISHIGRILPEDLDAFVGKEMEFRVIETGDKTVVSRKALEEDSLDLTGAWERIAQDQQLEGVIASVRPFGLFVDVGGLQGLVPTRELGWGESGDPTGAYKRGQAVTVRVMQLDRENHKITFSLKDPAGDPWYRVGADFVPGQTYTGTVQRLTDFGVFIALAPGLDGLLHISRSKNLELQVGMAIDVTLASADVERRRLELIPAGQEAPRASSPAANVLVEGNVIEVLSNGMLVELPDGRTGWLPSREVDLPAGTVLAQRFRRGKTVQVKVLKEDERRGQPTLTARTEVNSDDAWRDHAKKPKTAESFGTLGDLFSGIKL
ncbi:MAG: S1 RNA-binding domain-containing protein [Deltaproteobacteria bacterium]|nr:S1 RNA-binding domain-containing protein [Deltaproteobacteria bacterium]